MRIMGVDYGEARTGLALSDTSLFLASGIGHIKCTGMKNTAVRVAKEAADNNVGKIVVGLPVNMNGTEGERAQAVRAFVKLLGEETDAEICLFDERLTTAAAHTILNYTNTRGKKRKAAIDTLSAQIILQNYLDLNAGKHTEK